MSDLGKVKFMDCDVIPDEQRELEELRQHVDELTRERNLFKLAFTSIAGTIKLVTPTAEEQAVRQALSNIVSTLRMVSDEFKGYRK
jgi:hypothetical protein